MPSRFASEKVKQCCKSAAIVVDTFRELRFFKQ